MSMKKLVYPPCQGDSLLRTIVLPRFVLIEKKKEKKKMNTLLRNFGKIRHQVTEQLN
jgi:hypothetical protein